MGQVSSPAGSSWKISTTDRELSPGSNTGAGQTGNRVIMFGQNTGKNTVSSDMVLMGADVMGNGLQADSTMTGMIVIGSQAFASAIVNNTVQQWDSTRPSVVIGYNAFSTFPSQNGTPGNCGVYIGANSFQCKSVTGGTYALQSVCIGSNIYVNGFAGAPNGIQTSVVIGDSCDTTLQSLTTCVHIGANINVGKTVNESNSVIIGNGCNGSTPVNVSQAYNIMVGSGNSVTVAGVSSSCVLSYNLSIGASNCTFIGGGANSFLLPLGSLTSTPNSLLIGGPAMGTIYAQMASGNVLLGLTTGDTGRDFGSGTGSPTNALKLLNGTSQQFGPVAGGIAYVSAGSLTWFDQNSKRTTLTGPIVADGTYVKLVPLTGFTQAMTASVLQIVPAGTLATGTITLPVVTAANDGAIAEISSTQTITALTINPDAGHTVVGAPATIAANTGISFRYNATDAAWYRRY